MNLHCRYYHFQTVDSTNAFAKREFFSFSENELTVITADQQTGGYGRLQRYWHSPSSGNLYLTFVIFDERPAILFSKFAALCLEQLLQKLGCNVKIKWPNDLLVNGKKIAGILIEVKKNEDKTAIIIGIGLNVNMSEKELAQIPREATSLLQENNQSYDLKYLQQQLIEYFLSGIHFSQEDISKRWRQKISWMIGTAVTIQLIRESVSGIIYDFEPDGTLVLNVGNGKLRRILAGDLINR